MKFNTGTLANHLKSGLHAQLKAARDKAISEGFMHGRISKRLDGEDPRTVPLWRWMAIDNSSHGGGAAAPSSCSQSSSSFYLGVAATTDGMDSVSEMSSPYVPHGYENHFGVYPKISTMEEKRKQLNYLCGMIARDGRPLTIVRGAGYIAHVKELRWNWSIPAVKTVSENLLAMQIKRVNDLAAKLRKTKEVHVTRTLKLRPQHHLPYLPPEKRATAVVPISTGYSALSYDMWKRKHGNSYLGLSVHSLTHEFVKSDQLVFFREFTPRHVGTNVARAVDTFHAEMGIDGSFFEAAVLDGGSDVQKGARVAENRPPQIHKCSVHTLQRVIIEAVSKTKVILETVKEPTQAEIAAAAPNVPPPRVHQASVLTIKRLLKRGNKLVRLFKTGSR